MSDMDYEMMLDAADKRADAAEARVKKLEKRVKQLKDANKTLEIVVRELRDREVQK